MIRREERIDARFDRTHVTRGEDRMRLNHQENQRQPRDRSSLTPD